MGSLVWKTVVLMGIALLLILQVPSWQSAGEADFSLATLELQALLTRNAASLEYDLDGNLVALHEDILVFYRERQYAPAWFKENILTDQARLLLKELQKAHMEGLNPEDYLTSTITVFVEFDNLFHFREGKAAELARLDLLLTNAFLRYAEHLAQGRVDPAIVYPKEWRSVRQTVDAVELLRVGLEQQRISETLAEIVPDSLGYSRLRDYLAVYSELAAKGGWPQIPSGTIVRLGEKDWRLPWLRQRLLLTGDLAESRNPESKIFDAEVMSALQHFQKRHGLRADGVLGPQTLTALNVSVEERIRQIEINLERRRWLPGDLGDRYLVVNIADFHLSVIENGETILTMPVVVGTTLRRTPVFSSRLNHLIFSPYWLVPPTILREDKLPKMKENIDYLAAHHYKIIAWKDYPNNVIDPNELEWEKVNAENFPGVLRQDPGPWNALGRVKFMFPNTFDVYLHDTPDRHLFDREDRLFSSGCIRVERPVDLALYLLRDQKEWDEKHIRKAMSAEDPQRVNLKQPISVHIFYQTAWVDRQGLLQLRKDIYQRDRDLHSALTDTATAGIAEPDRITGASAL